MPPTSSLPLTPANRAFADQVEAIIRDRGPITTETLATICPESPVRRHRRQVGRWSIRATTPMTPSDVLPYLAALAGDYRIAMVAHGGSRLVEWQSIATPTIVPDLKDPVGPGDVHGDRATDEEGRQNR